jgi:hypothetical protein
MPRQPSLLAYLYTRNGSGWTCGCRDFVCRQSYWQIKVSSGRGGTTGEGKKKPQACGLGLLGREAQPEGTGAP